MNIHRLIHGSKDCPYSASKVTSDSLIIRGKLKIALAGIPNTGKSVVFNKLTGGRAWVGNWPGTTVEKKVGRLRLDSYVISIIDLPGTYTLSPDSIDQKIAKDVITEEDIDLVVVLLNASNIERSLYLLISILETGAKVVGILNFMDIADKIGIKYDIDKLSDILKIPIVPMVAVKNKGFDILKKRIVESVENEWINTKPINYNEFEEYIDRIVERLKESDISKRYSLRWIAIKLLENDRDVIEFISRQGVYDEVRSIILEADKYALERYSKHIDALIPIIRYQKINAILDQVIHKVAVAKKPFSDALDDILTCYRYAIFILIPVLYMLYLFSFEAAVFLSDLIDVIFSVFLSNIIYSLPFQVDILSFINEGILAGVGSVLVFLPNIALLFIGISVLEDVGYLSRVAYLLDRILSKVGLSGKSIIPMILGFGCNVPAVMATRVIEDDKARLITAMISPFMSCSARLPVYILFAGIFFPMHMGLVILILYLTGVVVAILYSYLFRRLVFRGPSLPFVIELPPYLIPDVKNVLLKSWVRIKEFVYRAGTIIVLASIVIWLLSVFGPIGYLGYTSLEEPKLLEESWIAYLGKVFEPLVKPLGWDWRAAVALLTGFIAKEVVVSTLAVLYGGEAVFKANLLNAFSPVSAFAYIIFVLLYVPCIATMAVLRSEFGNKTMIFTIIYMMLTAYIASYIVVVLATLLGV